jgi:hypothetical protein
LLCALALSQANAVRNPKKLLARSFSLLETEDFQYAFSQPMVIAKLQKSDYEESKHVLKILFIMFFSQMEGETYRDSILCGLKGGRGCGTCMVTKGVETATP